MTTSGPKRTRLGLAVATALVVSVGGAALLWGTSAEPAAVSLAGGDTDQLHPASPVPVGEDSEFVRTEVLDDGTLTVRHWIRTTVPMDRLALEVPPASGLTGETVQIDDLLVVSDDVDVASSQTGGEVWDMALPGAHELYAEYTLSGVSQRSGSADGRALATVTSLTLGVGSAPLARTQTFSGAKVLTLACVPPDGRAAPALCGTLVNDTWTLSSEPDAVPATVIAQLDLGRSASDR